MITDSIQQELAQLLTFRAGGGDDIYGVAERSVRFSHSEDNKRIIVDCYANVEDARKQTKRQHRFEFAIYRIENGRPIE